MRVVEGPGKQVDILPRTWLDAEQTIEEGLQYFHDARS